MTCSVPIPLETWPSIALPPWGGPFREGETTHTAQAHYNAFNTSFKGIPHCQWNINPIVPVPLITINNQLSYQHSLACVPVSWSYFSQTLDPLSTNMSRKQTLCVNNYCIALEVGGIVNIIKQLCWLSRRHGSRKGGGHISTNQYRCFQQNFEMFDVKSCELRMLLPASLTRVEWTCTMEWSVRVMKLSNGTQLWGVKEACV